MKTPVEPATRPAGGARILPVSPSFSARAAFGDPRDFLDNRHVYLVISSRARGLTVGINLLPEKQCDFDCRYCEVDPLPAGGAVAFDLGRMEVELRETLEQVQSGRLRQWPRYAGLPAELLEVRHVAISGNGEPTLSPHFGRVVQSLNRLRAVGRYFKIVLVTNATALDRPQVQSGLDFLARSDDIWAKLDAGTPEYFTRINGTALPFRKVLDNILQTARQRPVVIQSLFPALDGEEPSGREIREYAQRLKELRTAGAQISLVQIYSAARPMAGRGCAHLPLKTLFEIARTVRGVAGLRAEVF